MENQEWPLSKKAVINRGNAYLDSCFIDTALKPGMANSFLETIFINLPMIF